jgi:hypothetical protein
VFHIFDAAELFVLGMDSEGLLDFFLSAPVIGLLVLLFGFLAELAELMFDIFIFNEQMLVLSFVVQHE